MATTSATKLILRLRATGNLLEPDHAAVTAFEDEPRRLRAIDGSYVQSPVVATCTQRLDHHVPGVRRPGCVEDLGREWPKRGSARVSKADDVDVGPSADAENHRP